jgi:predicted TIM-barrel fold metal-dependent hydrolase
VVAETAAFKSGRIARIALRRHPAKPLQGVDTHAHVFSATAPAVAGARYRPAYAATLEDWRSRWGPSGITHGVVVQVSFFGTDNSEVLAAVAGDPARLRGVAVVDPSIDEKDLERLHEGGVRAIRLNLKSATDYTPYASGAWKALYRRVHARGWHVDVHVDTGRLPAIAPAFAGTPVALCFDHFGSPGTTPESVDATFAAVSALARDREVFAKLSGPYRLDGANPAALAARWLEAVGPRHLVWGSDWPWTRHERENDYGRLRSMLEDWTPSALRPAILWDNAARLYGFD